MTAALTLAKQGFAFQPRSNSCGLARPAQAGIGLERLDDAHEIVEADDPFELEAGALVAGPDYVGFDPSDLGQADDHPVSAFDSRRFVNHEAVRRDVRDMQLHVAALVMLGDHRIVDRMTR